MQAWEASEGDISCFPRKEQYSDAQKQAAVDHYLTHGCCLAFTRRELGYPCSVLLIRWIDELHPGRRRIHTGVQNASAPFRPEVKLQAVRDLCTRTTPAKKITQGVGVSRQVLYKWKDEAIGGETYQSMQKKDAPSLIQERDALREELARLTQAVKRQQLELDILRKAEEIIKKDPGISVSTLTNREKTKIADVLIDTHLLPELLSTLRLAGSSYFYHRAALRAGDKHAGVRVSLSELFHANYRCYGYRRLHAMLRHEGVRLSE